MSDSRLIERATAHVSALNTAWSTGDVDRVAQYFHEAAVLLPPDAGAPIVSRNAISATYRDFHTQATLHSFVTDEVSAYPFDDSVAVHLRFTVTYTLDGRTFEEKGLEIYHVAAGGTPLITWRAQIMLATLELTD